MEEGVLPVLPWSGVALGVVLLVGLQVPVPRAVRSPDVRAGLSPVGTRTGALALGALLVALVLGARLLGAGELDNPVSPLVVGLAWPLLLALPGLVAALLPARSGRRADGPADDVRPRSGRPADGPADDVRGAVPLAVLVVLLLVLVRAPGRPEVLGPALTAYGVLVLAVGVALGAGAAARCEVLGLLPRWAALGRRLTRWQPPRGAEAVLAVVLAGAWVERLQRTSAWTAAGPGRAVTVGALVLATAVAGALVVLLRRYGAAAVLLPLAAGAVLGGAVRRVLVSAQLLWDDLGPGAPPVDADPLGIAGGQLLALGVVTLGGALAAAVLARRAGPGADRLPGLGAVLLGSGVSALVVLQP